jgi:hypothetical protein
LQQNSRNLRDLAGTVSAGLDRIPSVSETSTRFDGDRITDSSLQERFDSVTVSAHRHHFLEVTGFGFLRCADSRPPRDALQGPQLGTYWPTHSPGGNAASGGT